MPIGQKMSLRAHFVAAAVTGTCCPNSFCRFPEATEHQQFGSPKVDLAVRNVTRYSEVASLVKIMVAELESRSVSV